MSHACVTCKRTTTTRARERTDPRTYKAERKVLCDRCAKEQGYGDPARQMIGRLPKPNDF